jgi:hypothetical protein
MDRLPRLLAACGLGLLLTSSGCRSTRNNEVPPGRPYSSDGRQRKPIEFSSEGHPINGATTAVFQPDVTPNMKPGSGVGAGGRNAGSTPFGAIPGPAYGGPGTAGLGEPPTPSAPAPAELTPASDSPASPELSVEPPSMSQTVAPSLDTPGTMGRPGDLPSPN